MLLVLISSLKSVQAQGSVLLVTFTRRHFYYCISAPLIRLRMLRFASCHPTRNGLLSAAGFTDSFYFVSVSSRTQTGMEASELLEQKNANECFEMLLLFVVMALHLSNSIKVFVKAYLHLPTCRLKLHYGSGYY